jgi:hypothetical protein
MLHFHPMQAGLETFASEIMPLLSLPRTAAAE